MAHKLWSPSAAHRWVACAPSRAAEQGYPERTSAEAAEGTLAHERAALRLQGLHAEISDPEMDRHVDAYVNYVRSLGDAVEVEVPLASAMSPDLGGTADAVVYGGGVLHVVDFKYGRGVRVAVEDNPQLLLYAMMAVEAAPWEFSKVVLHVHQPRIDNVSSQTVDRAALADFAQTVRRAIDRARAYLGAPAPEGPDAYAAGDHCRWCLHAANCPGLRAASIKAAQMTFGTVADAPTETLGEILAKADMIDAWIARVRQEALDRALAGATVDGYKLVAKRAVRSWASEQDAADLARMLGVDAWAPPALLSPPQLEKKLGKDELQKFASLMVKQPSGVTLVPVADKRPAIDPSAAAAAVFNAIPTP
jgi:hypothetical protein